MVHAKLPHESPRRHACSRPGPNPRVFIHFSGKEKAVPRLSGNFVSITGLLFSGSFCPGFPFFHHYLCRSRAILMGAMIHIQNLLGRLGMRVVTRGERWFFLWMMGRVRMGVVQGMVFVLFHVPVLVKACRCPFGGLLILWG